MTTFVTELNPSALKNIPVTVYDGDGVAIAAPEIVWSGLPADGSVTIVPGSAASTTTAVRSSVAQVVFLTATHDGGAGTLKMTFQPALLKFSSP